jgi:hypothetical protein
MSLPLALLTALLVIGVGGLAVTEGVRYGVGYITGNESGTDRLAQRTSASASGLIVTVEGVTYTAHFTRVDVAARNETGTTLDLPLFGYCVFTGREGTTLAADPFRSRCQQRWHPAACNAERSYSKVTCPPLSDERHSASHRSLAPLGVAPSPYATSGSDPVSMRPPCRAIGLPRSSALTRRGATDLDVIARQAALEPRPADWQRRAPPPRAPPAAADGPPAPAQRRSLWQTPARQPFPP